jgi:hypothetical protein
MATTDVLPNLLDWVNVQDPDGSIAVIAWTLAQTNDILKDMIFHEGNLPLGHRVTVNSGLPQGTWRGNNQGVASTKMLNGQFQFSIAQLAAYSKVDAVEAELNGEVGAFRLAQDQAHIMGMGQQIAAAMFYSNQATNPLQFTGFSPFYNSLTGAQTGRNIIDMGGTASANASLWLVGWGDVTNYALHPKGSAAGLVYKDKGDVRALYDANGNSFEGYTSYFEWKVGLAVQNWRYNVRLANIDTTAAGLKGAAPPDLFGSMSDACVMLPTFTRRASGITENDSPGDPMPGIAAAWYCNRTVRAALDKQAIRDKNVLISYTEYAGAPVMNFREIPVRVVDGLTNNEARIV